MQTDMLILCRRTGSLKVRFQFLAAASMKITVFLDVTLLLIALMMEVVNTSGTSVNFYQTTRRNFPEDSYLHLTSSNYVFR
jgi:hypothetical protein